MTTDLTFIEQQLRTALDTTRRNGWRDADVAHVVARVDRLLGEVVRRLDDGLDRWRLSRGLSPEAAARAAGEALLLVRGLRPIPAVRDGRPAGIDGGVLTKVRGLLAKAESTEFEPEAEALVAKAHELMARHAIDQALVGQPDGPADVVTRRVLIEDPYAYERSVLLAEVAEAFGCRVLAMTRLGLATVFGVADDVSATELLYTSLLLQATNAVRRARPEQSCDCPECRPAPSTVAAFRRSFLTGFAQRIGDRLAESREATVTQASAEQGTDVLPVLADRKAAVDAAFDECTAHLRFSRARRVSSAEGFAAGAAAGSRASLTHQSRLTGRTALGGGRT